MSERDPLGTDPHTPGAKLDAGKPMVWLCLAGFSNALAAVADVTTKGAIKYTPNGWMTVPGGQERYMEAFGRHMLALGSGELRDREQMAWNILASLELELRALEKQAEQVIQKREWAAEQQQQHEQNRAHSEVWSGGGGLVDSAAAGAIAGAGYGVPTGVVPR